MRHLDLYSGIGGFTLAAERLGWETWMVVENNPFCQRVLQARWPHVPLLGDVNLLLQRATHASLIPRLLEAGIALSSISGRIPSTSFTASDRVGSFLKTSLAMSLTTLSGRVVTSKVSVTRHGRSILELRSATTFGGASGLWPTPTAKANHNAPSMRKWPAYARLQKDGGAFPSRWEWMMGFPIGHTACDLSGTLWSQTRRSSSCA